MPRTKVKLNNSNGLNTDSILDQFKTKEVSIEYFIRLHEKFVDEKRLEGLSKRTIDDHISHMHFFDIFIKTLENIDIERVPLSKELLKNYLVYMIIDKKYKPCTINLRLSTLKCYLAWLSKNKHTNENYALVLHKVRTPEDTILPLSIEEVKKMLSTLNRDTYVGLRDFSIMIIILDCGIRIQELCNTLIPDVNFKNKTLMVRATVAKNRQFREIPLSKQSLMLLKQLIDIAESNNSGFVFMSSQTAEKLDHNVVIKNFEKYGAKAGIKKRCTPHVFRHTYALNAVKKGMNVFYLQRILGHNNIQTTRKYVQLQTSDLQKVHSEMNMLDMYLKGGK